MGAAAELDACENREREMAAATVSLQHMAGAMRTHSRVQEGAQALLAPRPRHNIR